MVELSLKALVILSDREDLKPYWKSEKRPHFSRSSTILLFTSFSETFTNLRKKTNRAVVFSCRAFPNILTGTTNETFQQSGKQGSFRHLLKSSASV